MKPTRFECEDIRDFRRGNGWIQAFVAGSAVFGTPDYAATIAELRRRAGIAHR